MMAQLALILSLLGGVQALVLPTLPTRAVDAFAHERARATRANARMYTTWEADETIARVQRVLAVKEQSGKTFDELANSLGLTNTYTVQLFLGQAQLKPATAEKLKAALPDLEDDDVKGMQGAPMRGFEDEILKEPNVYRTHEAITHYGEAIKTLINEQCGDGIMSAIDFYLDVGTTTGKLGEKRVVITFNGKVMLQHTDRWSWRPLSHARSSHFAQFLPFIEQVAEDNGAPSPRD